MSRPKLAGLILSVLFLSSCGDSNYSSTQSTDCTSATAQILVGDGFQRRLCGCAETAGDYAFPPTALTCTVSAGQTVFFVYSGTKLKHQIVSSSGTTVMASSISDPDGHHGFSYPVTFSQSGSFPYLDNFAPGLTGTIVVP